MCLCIFTLRDNRGYCDPLEMTAHPPTETTLPNSISEDEGRVRRLPKILILIFLNFLGMIKIQHYFAKSTSL